MDNQPAESEAKKKKYNTQPVGAQRVTQPLSTRRGMAWLAVLSVLMLLLAVAGVWYFMRLRSTNLSEILLEKPPASLEELAEKYPELAPILQDSELDSVYKEFFVAYQDGGPEAALDLARRRGILSEDNELRMTLELDTTDSALLVEQLEAGGIKVTAANGYLVDIAMPVSLVEAAIEAGDPSQLFRNITELEHVIRIRLPRVNIQDSVNQLETESLSKIGVTNWHTAGYSGKGIRIGVLDMGFNDYKGLLGRDLPTNVTAKSFIYGSEIDNTDTNHGTACAEIIYDIAPQAELFFAAYRTDAEQSQAIDWLLAQDLDIISHSATSIYGPMDGSGADAQVVNRIVDGGVLWVNSAGNTAETHYRAVFTDSDGDGFHEFRPGDELMGFAPDGNAVLVLNWDDWEYGTQDYDLFVVDEDQNEIASSKNVQDGAGDDAAELISYIFPDTGPYYIIIYARNTTRAATLNFYAYHVVLEYVSTDHSITTPADAEKALAVGAVYWEDDSLESYSSQGPTNDGRIKPDISAPAGVSSAARGKLFFGTSASAPHVAGAAALVLEAYPDFSPAEVTTFLESRAVDLGGGGPDHQFGYGRLAMGEAPAFGIVPTLPVVLPTVTPQPTEAALVKPTNTAAPKRNPTSTPIVDSGEEEDSEISGEVLLALMACVALPGALGLGGIGLLGFIWYKSRSRQPGRPVAAPQPYRPAAQPAYPPPRAPYSPPAPRPAPSPAPAPRPGNQCPKCGAPHRSEARFCITCGFLLAPGAKPAAARPDAPKPAFCIYCGQALRPTSKFCTRCGRAKP